ncbi:MULTISPECIES: hypothetical protein [unclassified Streptomyces]|uniref:hypothetical protein n=1 Tax=unclassified Streptomyces TaxID=2593676 RepID=UPI002E2C0EA3|nr:hypothetical protein [Streptomyces sp. NBC_00223]
MPECCDHPDAEEPAPEVKEELGITPPIGRIPRLARRVHAACIARTQSETVYLEHGATHP